MEGREHIGYTEREEGKKGTTNCMLRQKVLL